MLYPVLVEPQITKSLPAYVIVDGTRLTSAAIRSMTRFGVCRPIHAAAYRNRLLVPSERTDVLAGVLGTHYFACRKRFSISGQFTTFHQAPTYSARRF